MLTLKGLKWKIRVATKRMKRLRLLGNAKRLKAAGKVRRILTIRLVRMKTRIRARKLRLRRRYYRLQASKRRARIQRARRKAIKVLQIRANLRLRRLKLLARRRLARARRLARLRLMRRYRMMAKLRARQRAQRRKMIALAKKRMRLLQRRVLLRQQAMQARLQAMTRRAARLRMLQFRIKARQKNTTFQLSKTRKILTTISQQMSYYRRIRRNYILKCLQVLRRYQMKKASRLRLRWFRYQRQTVDVRRRQRLLALRKKRTARRMREYQKNVKAWFKKQQQKLTTFVVRTRTSRSK